MAGSYDHILGGWGMIENMGDAYEAVEELMWLIQSQVGTQRALQLLKTECYPMRRGEKPRDQAMLEVESMMNDEC